MSSKKPKWRKSPSNSNHRHQERLQGANILSNQPKESSKRSINLINSFVTKTLGTALTVIFLALTQKILTNDGYDTPPTDKFTDTSGYPDPIVYPCAEEIKNCNLCVNKTGDDHAPLKCTKCNKGSYLFTSQETTPKGRTYCLECDFKRMPENCEECYEDKCIGCKSPFFFFGNRCNHCEYGRARDYYKESLMTEAERQNQPMPCSMCKDVDGQCEACGYNKDQTVQCFSCIPHNCEFILDGQNNPKKQCSGTETDLVADPNLKVHRDDLAKQNKKFEFCKVKCNDLKTGYKPSTATDPHPYGTCATCINPSCTKCFLDYTDCTECLAGYFLNKDPQYKENAPWSQLPLRCMKQCYPPQAWIEGNVCKDCSTKIEHCIRCKNSTLDCEECHPDYFLTVRLDDGKQICKRKCPSNKYWELPNQCISCLDKQCDVCFNSTYDGGSLPGKDKGKCEKCYNGYFANGTQECQKKCLLLDRASKIRHTAWVDNNTCSRCHEGCYECQNETLACADHPVEVKIEQFFPDLQDDTSDFFLRIWLVNKSNEIGFYPNLTSGEGTFHDFLYIHKIDGKEASDVAEPEYVTFEAEQATPATPQSPSGEQPAQTPSNSENQPSSQNSQKRVLQSKSKAKTTWPFSDRLYGNIKQKTEDIPLYRFDPKPFSEFTKTAYRTQKRALQGFSKAPTRYFGLIVNMTSLAVGKHTIDLAVNFSKRSLRTRLDGAITLPKPPTTQETTPQASTNPSPTTRSTQAQQQKSTQEEEEHVEYLHYFIQNYPKLITVEVEKFLKPSVTQINAAKKLGHQLAQAVYITQIFVAVVTVLCLLTKLDSAIWVILSAFMSIKTLETLGYMDIFSGLIFKNFAAQMTKSSINVSYFYKKAVGADRSLSLPNPAFTLFELPMSMVSGLKIPSIACLVISFLQFYCKDKIYQDLDLEIHPRLVIIKIYQLLSRLRIALFCVFGADLARYAASVLYGISDFETSSIFNYFLAFFMFYAMMKDLRNLCFAVSYYSDPKVFFWRPGREMEQAELMKVIERDEVTGVLDQKRRRALTRTDVLFLNSLGIGKKGAGKKQNRLPAKKGAKMHAKGASVKGFSGSKRGTGGSKNFSTKNGRKDAQSKAGLEMSAPPVRRVIDYNRTMKHLKIQRHLFKIGKFEFTKVKRMEMFIDKKLTGAGKCFAAVHLFFKVFKLVIMVSLRRTPYVMAGLLLATELGYSGYLMISVRLFSNMKTLFKAVRVLEVVLNFLVFGWNLKLAMLNQTKTRPSIGEQTIMMYLVVAIMVFHALIILYGAFLVVTKFLKRRRKKKEIEKQRKGKMTGRLSDEIIPLKIGLNLLEDGIIFKAIYSDYTRVLTTSQRQIMEKRKEEKDALYAREKEVLNREKRAKKRVEEEKRRKEKEREEKKRKRMEDERRKLMEGGGVGDESMAVLNPAEESFVHENSKKEKKLEKPKKSEKKKNLESKVAEEPIDEGNESKDKCFVDENHPVNKVDLKDVIKPKKAEEKKMNPPMMSKADIDLGKQKLDQKRRKREEELMKQAVQESKLGDSKSPHKRSKSKKKSKKKKSESHVELPQHSPPKHNKKGSIKDSKMNLLMKELEEKKRRAEKMKKELNHSNLKNGSQESQKAKKKNSDEILIPISNPDMLKFSALNNPAESVVQPNIERRKHRNKSMSPDKRHRKKSDGSSGGRKGKRARSKDGRRHGEGEGKKRDKSRKHQKRGKGGEEMEPSAVWALAGEGIEVKDEK